jgi:hypothetical protein
VKTYIEEFIGRDRRRLMTMLTAVFGVMSSPARTSRTVLA